MNQITTELIKEFPEQIVGRLITSISAVAKKPDIALDYIQPVHSSQLSYAVNSGQIAMFNPTTGEYLVLVHNHEKGMVMVDKQIHQQNEAWNKNNVQPIAYRSQALPTVGRYIVLPHEYLCHMNANTYIIW